MIVLLDDGGYPIKLRLLRNIRVAQLVTEEMHPSDTHEHNVADRKHRRCEHAETIGLSSIMLGTAVSSVY